MVSESSQQFVLIPVDSVTLEGGLDLPKETKAVVVFAHGSGSSRHSPRNKFVAQVLREAEIGTLLFDLLTKEEDEVHGARFDIDLLTLRLKAVTFWLKAQPHMRELNIGYFGASTGAAAALRAAADLGTVIGAIVSRGGRPDLAEKSLEKVQSPTLLIVGGFDDVVIHINQQAYRKIKTEKELTIIPAATHLFEEPGALEEVARLATEWFKKHLLAKHAEG